MKFKTLSVVYDELVMRMTNLSQNILSFDFDSLREGEILVVGIVGSPGDSKKEIVCYQYQKFISKRSLQNTNFFFSRNIP